MYPIHSGVSSIYSDFIHCRTERSDEKAAPGWGGSSCGKQTSGDTHTLSYLAFSSNPLLLLPILCWAKRRGILANLTMPLFLCWSCVCNAFCLGLCVRSSVEVFVVITLEAMASAGNAPCPPQLSTRHQPPHARIQKGSRFSILVIWRILLTFGIFASFAKRMKAVLFYPFHCTGRYRLFSRRLKKDGRV